MSKMKARAIYILIMLHCISCTDLFAAETKTDYHLKAGPLQLNIYISRTAHLFHAVDQISQWSEFCHRQYIQYFEGLDGGLSKDDKDLLAQHCAIRKVRGWGQGLEQTFYTSFELDSALAFGVKEGHLTKEEAETERRILTHFQQRVERLMLEELVTLNRFAQKLLAQEPNITAFANDTSQFVGGVKLTIPVYLIANPNERTCGGGFNGGRLTLEIARNYDMYPNFLHELFHAFIKTKQNAIESAAASAPGLDAETLSEGLVHAYSPGIIHTGDSDQLLSTVARFMSQGSSLDDSYTRFNEYGLALRPLLKEALSDKRHTLEAFLPRATDAWLVLTELDKARVVKSDSQTHDYRKNTKHSIFIFGIWDKEGCQSLQESTGWNIFGRNHAADQYEKMLTKNAKSGDTIILLLSLDDKVRVPDRFSYLMSSPWSEIEGRLKQGRTVFTRGSANEMAVFILATPTIDTLRSEFRRLAAEKKFVANAAEEVK